MYPDSGYKRAHAQSVCTRPFSRVGRGLGTRLALYIHVYAIYSYDIHACYPCAMPRHVVGNAQYCGFVRMLEQAADDLYLMFSVVLYY